MYLREDFHKNRLFFHILKKYFQFRKKAKVCVKDFFFVQLVAGFSHTRIIFRAEAITKF